MDDRLEKLLDELRTLRQEGQGIREALERLLVPLTHIESWLTQQGKSDQMPVSSMAQEVLPGAVEPSSAELKAPAQEPRPAPTPVMPATKPKIMPEISPGVGLGQRLCHSINVFKGTLTYSWILLKRFFSLGRIKYVFPIKKVFTLIIICLSIYGASFIGMFDWAEVLFSNVRYAFKGQAQPSNKIALVLVDNKSLQELEPFGKSWRQYHGRILKNLADDGVRAVGFDFSFSSPSEHDQFFIDGINYARKKGVAVVVATQYDEASKSFSPTIASIENSVTAVGHAYLRKDRVTNLVRWAPLRLEEIRAERAIQFRKPYLSLTAQLATLQGTTLPAINADNNFFPIQFQGGKSSFKSYSYAQVYKNAFPPGSFKDKLVLIGTALPMHKDFYDVPGRSQMVGVEIHAHALYTVLTGDIRKMGSAGMGIAILCAALVAGVVFSHGNTFLRAIGLPSLLVLYWVASIYYFLQKPPLELNIVYPSLSFTITWGILSLQEKIATRRVFACTVGLPEKVIRRLETDPDFQEGEARKLLTVLESDIMNYSVFSSQNPTSHVRALISEYNSAIEKVIYKHGGYVNKYIGDAVLAIFGYPMEEKDSARRAVRAAWEMQQALKELVQRWKQENKNCFERIRIGINHGYVSISYLGRSKKQLDVLGDNVDLAARIESAAGKFNEAALLSPSTYEEVKDIIVGKKVAVELKNRPDVKEAYTLEGIIA
ncbi:MAG: adenylate/guanylate cyclase domain-containing protein [Planctomycetota bacterium]|mgnify:FL=1